MSKRKDFIKHFGVTPEDYYINILVPDKCDIVNFDGVVTLHDGLFDVTYTFCTTHGISFAIVSEVGSDELFFFDVEG